MPYIIILLIAILLLALWLYRRAIRPMRVIASGMDLLREQDFSSRLRHVGERKADRIVDIFNRMMDELKAAHVQLEERNHLLNLLVEVSPMGIIMLDFDGRIASLNPAACQFLGCTEGAKGCLPSELTGDVARCIATLKDDEQQTLHTSDAHIYRCTRRSFMDRGFQHPFVLIESLTQDVMQAERTAYGKVIRMMSHEVNNSMAGIGSIMETVIEALKESANATEVSDAFDSSYNSESADLALALEACLSRSRDMAAFITRFASVVKIPEPHLQPTPLNQLVTANSQYLESLCTAHHIQLDWALAPESPTVQMDEALMAQVLVNIVKNSIESIEQTGKEENMEEGNNAEKQKGWISVSTVVQSAETSMLVVADNGAGILPDVASQLFTPFFSTKKNGHGIGLLLVREILTRHHCRFSLRTDNDGVTRFTVQFNRLMYGFVKTR